MCSGTEFEIRHVDGADRGALLPALADADARADPLAPPQIDAEALAAAPALKVVARAGIGLDNVDVPAATARGVLVVNAPQSNIVTAAEHAVALLLSVARHDPGRRRVAARRASGSAASSPASSSPTRPSASSGSAGSGSCSRQRIAAFGTTVIAYDPYLQPARAAALGVAAGRPADAAGRPPTSSPSTCRRPPRRWA